MIPTSEALKQFLVGHILPVLVGVITTWLFATVHVFNLFGVSEGQVAGELTQFGTFAIASVLAWLTTHHVLLGRYTPASKASVK